MTSEIHWITQFVPAQTLRFLGLTLEHFLWEGTVLALVLFALTQLCQRAQVRYVLGVCTLSAMLLCPVVTFTLLVRSPQTSALLPHTPGAPQLSALPTPLPGASLSDPGVVSRSQPMLPPDFPVWCAWAWLAGVVVFSLRTLGGWLVITNMRRRCTEAMSPEFLRKCRELERRLSLRRQVRYLQSRVVESPSVIGWWRPVVLLPLGAISGLSPEQLEAVIVHELAHIRRLDCIVNLIQVAAETLFFYHPAVWWVNRAIRNERENCCDDVSVEICGNAVEYAKALTVLESARATPNWALSVTGGVLKARVMRLLRPEPTIGAPSSAGLGVIGVFCTVSVLVAAAIVAKADVRSPRNNNDLNQTAVAEPVDASRPVVAASTDLPMARTSAKRAPAAKDLPQPVALAEARAQAEPPGRAESSASPKGAVSYIDALQAAGLKDLSVDNLVALKVQGVTPEYVSQMHQSGFDPDVHDLIGMKVQGITPEYVKDIRAAGLNPTVHELIEMKVQNVTPDYVRSMQAIGLTPNVHELIGMKVQDITPEYIRALRAAGLTDLKVHDAIGAKVMGITPEFVEKARSHGFKSLNLHQLMALKNADVL